MPDISKLKDIAKNLEIGSPAHTWFQQYFWLYDNAKRMFWLFWIGSLAGLFGIVGKYSMLTNAALALQLSAGGIGCALSYFRYYTMDRVAKKANED